MENREKITLSNKIEELTALASKIEELAENWQLPMPLTMNINLVLEEAVTNIISYAYPSNEIQKINIEISINNSNLQIIITDQGIAFDPTSNAEPDIHLPAAERPIGGLGIFLITKIMDTVEYQRIDETNQLTLQKNISQ